MEQALSTSAMVSMRMRSNSAAAAAVLLAAALDPAAVPVDPGCPAAGWVTLGSIRRDRPRHAVLRGVRSWGWGWREADGGMDSGIRSIISVE